jgi:excisionase family DNA binding protein
MYNSSNTNITDTDDIVLTQKQLAERLQTSIRTIQNWKSQGRLPFTRIGNSVRFHWGLCKKALGMN